MRDLVVIDHGSTTPAQRASIAAACAEAEVEWCAWRAREAPPSSSLLVVAGLVAGRREIDADVAALADSVPLLLLANEPLVRPAVNLQNGRVVVLAEPHERETLFRHVRMLACRRAAGIEHLRPRFWCAGLSERPRWDVREGMTVVIPREGEVDDASCEAAMRLLDGVELAEHELHTSLAGVLGDGVGVVRLEADADRWTCYWPEALGVLELFSTLRLPRRFDLGRALSTSSHRVVRLPAKSGDVLVAVAAEHRVTDDAFLGGGPRVLSRLAQSTAASTAAGAIVEIR